MQRPPGGGEERGAGDHDDGSAAVSAAADAPKEEANVGKHHIFVYGTLLRGLRNHHVMAARKDAVRSPSLVSYYA